MGGIYQATKLNEKKYHLPDSARSSEGVRGGGGIPHRI